MYLGTQARDLTKKQIKKLRKASSLFVLEQLTPIVKESNSNDELLARLIETKYVTTGSYNFYRERRMVRMMNGNKG